LKVNEERRVDVEAVEGVWDWGEELFDEEVRLAMSECGKKRAGRTGI
jgi:hypothetical protein